ncbi:hypothetical protein SEVIR_5G131000v4 [Setaria viridis]|uniref:Uncharacterized protein n=2 Tax=Setaria TaxID=4554 RepID=K3XLU9_SETIT|nr:uncharacterized protein LOC101782161 [Setaria italica]XP_034597656.1 uncharacterized protein LOC117858661 [Setaria viridis]RCV25022.1 hypothetical protein SETIT_5G133100v2 [Setaria italica]TKW13895.1 hypothetical protein SEVIR_5G131000v2 [Setaria viridis]
MDIAGMFRPALEKIKSSIPSAADYARVLTGSFNDRTSLLLGAELAGRPAQAEEEPAPPAQEQEAAPTSITTVVHAFDIEAATPLQAAASAGEGGRDQEPADQLDAESRRVAKSVQTVCLFAASASLVLFVNRPSRDDSPSQQSKQPAGAAALYSAGLAFISLGFFSSLVLSMFSIVARPGEAAVARVQKWGMMVAVASVVVAFTLRMCMVMLPAASL